ncbi:MAG: hypothetical protein DHS20C18_29270 [Saprospiraceae bacterium]|nr:MAG: hypothetical protein DHS20C18_29270 [Saprospiraceae bacterium]
MKIYLFLPLLLLGCQNKQPERIGHSADEKSTAEPMQWVTYQAKDNAKDKHIVLVSGDEEYRSEEALPQLAKILTYHHGFDCTVLFAQDPQKPGLIDPNYSYNIPGLAQLKDADLMILFTRFRALPSEQMQHIENYLSAGKPLVAIRTATHAFNFDQDSQHPFKHYAYNYKGENTAWHLGFGKRVLGETWYNHHGHHKHQSTRGIIAPGAEHHPIVNGINDGAIWGPSDVYGIRQPIGGDAQTIVLGQTIDREGPFDEQDTFYGMRESDKIIANKRQQDTSYNPNETMPPIVWTKPYQIPGGKTGQSLTSTIGAATDMVDEEVRRMFVNATYYLLALEVPQKAKVDIIGKYEPSAFKFQDDDYWEKRQLKVLDFVEDY